MMKILVCLLMSIVTGAALAAGATIAPQVVEGFGANATSGYITNPIPVPSQIGITDCRASYNDGFPPLSMTAIGGCNPFGQDMNGVLYAATANIAMWSGGQSFPFNSTFATANSGYANGAIVAMAAGNGLWLNLNNGNTVNPDTSTPGNNGWAPLAAYTTVIVPALTSGAVTLSAAQAAGTVIFLTGAITGNVQVIFPTWVKNWIVVNETTGAFSVTAKTASGTGVIVPQLGQSAPTQIYCDATNIQLLSAVPGQTLSAHKNSATSRASTTTPTNDPDLILVVPAAGVYEVSGTLFFAQTAGGGGIKIGLNYTGTATQGVVQVAGFVNNAIYGQFGVESFGLQIFGGAIDNTALIDSLTINGTFFAATAGTYSVQWAQNSSNANATFLENASFIKLSPIN